MKITVAKLNELGSCKDGVEWFAEQDCADLKKVILKAIATKELRILKYANWGITRFLRRMDKIRYAVYAAEQVIDKFETKHPKDDRPRKAIEAAKTYLKSPTQKNKDAAYAAASSASSAAYAADAAAYATSSASSAAHAADAAADAASSASSASSAAYAAADAAADAAAAAYAAADAADAAAAYAAAYAADAAAAADAARIKTLIKILQYGVKLIKE